MGKKSQTTTNTNKRIIKKSKITVDTVNKWGSGTIVKMFDRNNKPCFYVHEFLSGDELYGQLIVINKNLSVEKILKHYEHEGHEVEGLKFDFDTGYLVIDEDSINDANDNSDPWKNSSLDDFYEYDDDHCAREGTIEKYRIMLESGEKPESYHYPKWNEMKKLIKCDVKFFCDYMGRGMDGMYRFCDEEDRNKSSSEIMKILLKKKVLVESGDGEIVTWNDEGVCVKLDEYNRAIGKAQ